MKDFCSLFLLLIFTFFSSSSIFTQPSGSALEFDGFDDGVDLMDAPSLDMTDWFTIAAWIYLYKYVEWASIVTKGLFFENNYTIHQSGPAGGRDFWSFKVHRFFTGAPLIFGIQYPNLIR